MNMDLFERDDEKAASNKAKHNVSFDEAETVFGDFLASVKPDIDHSESEDRFLIIGSSVQSRLLIVSYTYRGNKIRLISARPATPQEKKGYQNDRNN